MGCLLCFEGDREWKELSKLSSQAGIWVDQKWTVADRNTRLIQY